MVRSSFGSCGVEQSAVFSLSLRVPELREPGAVFTVHARDRARRQLGDELAGQHAALVPAIGGEGVRVTLPQRAVERGDARAGVRALQCE